MRNKLRYLPLAVILSATPVLAQEDNEQEIRIELESGGSPATAIVNTNINNNATSVVANADGSVWYRRFNDSTDDATYCWVDDDKEPHCKLVRVED